MDKYFHPTLYNGCNYLSMLGLKLIHVRKRGHRPHWAVIHQCTMLSWKCHAHMLFSSTALAELIRLMACDIDISCNLSFIVLTNITFTFYPCVNFHKQIAFIPSHIKHSVIRNTWSIAEAERSLWRLPCCHAITDHFNMKPIFPNIGIPIVKISWSFDHFILVIGIPFTVRWHLFYWYPHLVSTYA